MPKAHQQQARLFVAMAFLLLLTGLSLCPGKHLAFIEFPGGTILYHFAAYGCFSWLMLASLGHCPLRWRRLYPWVLVMVLAHAYWMEFFQGHIPGLQRQFSAVDLLAAMTGAIGGVMFRLRFAYQQCNCSLMGRSARPEAESMMGNPAESGEKASVSRPFPVTVADHPNLNEIIAMSFG